MKLSSIPLAIIALLALAPLAQAQVDLRNGITVNCQGRTLEVQSPDQTAPVKFEVAPAPIMTMTDSLFTDTLKDRLSQWHELVQKSAVVSLPRFSTSILVPGSVSAFASAAPPAKNAESEMIASQAIQPNLLPYLDKRFGQILGLDIDALKKTGQNTVKYNVRSKRVDTLVSDATGKVKLLTGTPNPFAPNQPEIAKDQTPLANIVSESGKEELFDGDIRPIDEPVARTQPSLLPNFTAKLTAGTPVKIVFVGDSITCGAFALNPRKFFANQLLDRLHVAYPQSKIGFLNMGYAGSTSIQSAANFDAAITMKPDLIVVEFVNDFKLPQKDIETSFTGMVGKAKAASIDLLVCAPHLPLPSYLSMKDWKQVSESPYPTFLRQLCKEQNVALADVAQRWANLHHEGLDPALLLVDEQLHPNETGNNIYADELFSAIQGSGSPQAVSQKP